MIQSQLISIVNQTNLHVGSGSETGGIIDNVIYRDFTTSLPGIPGSGLKGALRERLNAEVAQNQLPRETIRTVFGSERNEAKAENMKRGDYYFQEALMLSYPYRGEVFPYYNATTPQLIETFLEKAKLFHFPLSDSVISILHKLSIKEIENNQGFILSNNLEGGNNSTAEDVVLSSANLISIPPEVEMLFGGNLILVSHSNFVERVNDFNLPVVARNQLNHGVSENLFYEQILPRYSHFFSYFTYEKKCLELEKSLKTNPIVQIGANASIGYGWCKLSLFDKI